MIEGKKERKKQKREKPEIWVDIGAGSNPLGLLLKKLEELKGKVYIGIDINQEEILTNRNWLKLLKVKAEKILHIVAMAEKLPIKDNSCDQVFLANFLGDPIISQKTKEKALKEILRILKPGGLLNIIEIYTPPLKNEVIEMIKNLGFEFLKENTSIIISTYLRDSSHNYYLIFRKPT
jgi:ubiquinone/menaquinone biosynthesis C-methylase UbiE